MRRRLIYNPCFTTFALILTLALSFVIFPIAESQHSAEIKSKLNELQEGVSELPLDEAFENINSAKGRRTALTNKIKAVIHQIEAGANEGAIDKLENDLKNTIMAWVNDGYEDPLLEKVNEIIDLIRGVPVAAFSFKPETPTVGEVVTFNASVSYDPNGYVVSYVWDFGDGANDTGMVVEHIYLTAETFTVTLTVADNDGFTDTAKADMNVIGVSEPIHDMAIISVVSSPSVVKVGCTVAINVTVLNEGTVTETFNASVYYNLTLLETRTDITLDAGAQTTLTFTWVTTIEGIYDIWAEVQPLPGESDVADNILVDETVTVTSLQSPVASFSFSPMAPYTEQNVTFDASLSYDPDGMIVSCIWSFGDGITGNGEIVKHSYADNGTYTVELTVVDNDGLTDSESESITVLNRPPTAFFTENATTVYRGEAVRFNASESFDPDGYISSYFWTFGDGTNATGANATHAYAEIGTYVVNLTVTDNDGATASSTGTKTVLNRPPVALFTESALTVFPGEVIQLNASDSYDPDGSIVSYTWDFGNNNITTTSTATIDHVYTTPGTYNITLTVTDDDGLTDDKVKTFTIQVVPWPLWLIVAVILLILAATATAIYLWRKRRKEEAQ